MFFIIKGPKDSIDGIQLYWSNDDWMGIKRMCLTFYGITTRFLSF